ncbi:hypothetical protein BGZ80_000858 [Entomortierella chlamydospora]|uniref:WD40 repeat-like protein n=1 Tax=Entomortierella chlamydospora TaxID=101097 RepID=A0A9P6N1X5_9FUNG|nr:hypothetical protein BGZ80_000858 [Entomortierella chlamydospora]
MSRSLISSSLNDVPPGDTTDPTDEHLENACNAETSTKAMPLYHNVEAVIKDEENAVVNKRISDRTLNDDVDRTYYRHEEIVEELEQHSKAQKSYGEAEMWRYPDVASQHSRISQSANPNASILGSAQQVIFTKDVTPSIAGFTLPEVGGRITSTLQLAYCISLLDSSLISNEELSKTEHDWSQAMINNPDEQARLHTMATDITRAFVRDELKRPDIVIEATNLAAVLEYDEFRKLLQVFIDGIGKSLLLNFHLLDGLSLLIRNAPQENIDLDDLVKILELLGDRFQDTHQQSAQHIYRLVLTISRVLDSMVDSQVKGIKREQLHEPLSQYLKDLQKTPDPSMVYRAVYAYQALQYIPDDETILQTLLRRTGKVAKGVSGVVSAVKALNVNDFIKELMRVQESLAGASEAISMASDAYQNAKALVGSGQGFLESLQESFSSRKSAWYPALRGLDLLIQGGRLSEFETLIRQAPCRKDPAYQWGVCQRLGELAINMFWDINTRQCAISLLGEMYADDATWGQLASTKQLTLRILHKLSESSEGELASHAKGLLLDLEMNGDSEKRSLYQACMQEDQSSYLLAVTPPSHESSRLLDIVQNKPDVEAPLLQLKRERLKEHGRDVYILPRAKTSANATKTFDLTSNVQEFLDSGKKVFLVLGDSGSGKSTFNRALEINLWHKYSKTGGKKIPLFIHLPAMKDPKRDLIAERLRQANFTENQIIELKLYHRFVLICDGYDESQQTSNLYMTNQLNQPGQWQAQMVIGCRTEYIGSDYKTYFQPTGRNGSGGSELYQEAIVAPFNKKQVQDCIEQYVDSEKLLWRAEDYQRAFEQVPNLMDLVKNPFLLKLALDVLPRLLGVNSDFSIARITRVELYDEFVHQWIQRNHIRLTEIDLCPRDREALKVFLDEGFCQHGVRFMKDLAIAIYEEQGGNPVVHYSDHVDHKTWKKAFFDNCDGKNLLREAIPFIHSNGQYRFIHKSVLEYGISLAAYDPSARVETTQQEPRISRRGSTSSAFSFEDTASIDEPVVAMEQHLLDSPFGRKSFVHEPSVVQFLVERAQQQPDFRELLLAVIERSKTEKTARIAAANAITVLVRSGEQFNGADLKDIKIPGADLSYGIFDSARLDRADLRKTKLQNIWLRNANLNWAEMQGVQFGELPFLKEDDAVYQCAYWHDGKTLAVGLRNGSFSLYDTSSWEKIKEFGRFEGQQRWPLFSEASDQVAFIGPDYILGLLDVKTGNCFQVLKGHTDWANSVVYSPSGGKAASGGRDKTVRVWDIDTGECIHVLRGHDNAINSLAYSPCGYKIASAGFDGTIRLWNVETGECIHVLLGDGTEVYSVAYSPKGGQIASGSKGATIRLWDVETGNCIHDLRGHVRTVYLVAYSPDGSQIISGGQDKTIRLWDVETRDCIHTLPGHSTLVSCIAYSPNGSQIASGSSDATVRLWTTESNYIARVALGHAMGVNSVAYSPNGSHIISGSDDKTIRLWDVETGNCVYNFLDHSERVGCVAYSPKEGQIASGSSDMTVKLWDVETGGCFNTLRGHEKAVCSVVYSPNGDRVASGSDDQTVRLWDVKTGGCLRIMHGHIGDVNCIAYSPKGDRIISGSHDSTVKLWDVETGETIHTLQGHEGHIYGVSYSPNGDQITSGGADKTVRLWDIQTACCIRILRGHVGTVVNVAYSPDGDKVASGSFDKKLRLWNVETGQCLTVIPGFNGSVFGVAWKSTSNGECLVTGSIDKSVRHWEIIREQDEYTVQLHWSSSHDAFTAIDASFKEVRGLSKVNQTLIDQRGAVL